MTSLMVPTRRRLLGGMVSLIYAPPIVRATSLMPIAPAPFSPGCDVELVQRQIWRVTYRIVYERIEGQTVIDVSRVVDDPDWLIAGCETRSNDLLALAAAA